MAFARVRVGCGARSVRSRHRRSRTNPDGDGGTTDHDGADEVVRRRRVATRFGAVGGDDGADPRHEALDHHEETHDRYQGDYQEDHSESDNPDTDNASSCHANHPSARIIEPCDNSAGRYAGTSDDDSWASHNGGRGADDIINDRANNTAYNNTAYNNIASNNTVSNNTASNNDNTG